MLMTVVITSAQILETLLVFSCEQECCCYLRVQEFNSTHSRVRSLIARYAVQRLSLKRVHQIEIRVRVLWLSGRPLAPQARGVLGSTASECQRFYFPLFLPHNI